MRVLLDTHTLIWAFDDPAKLSPLATTTILDPANERFVSLATAWELAIKVSLKKLTLSMPYRAWLEKALLDLNAALASITLDHIETVLALPHHHKDPFDRLIVAQARSENMEIVSIDPALDPYCVRRIW
jgi:PIN domain nuclease of toxin-antitoxin system